MREAARTMGEPSERSTAGGRAIRVLVLAPMGRNALVLCQMLTAGGMTCVTCEDVDKVIENLGDAGAVLSTDNALLRGAVDALAGALRGQPPWSDVPVIVLASGEEL